MFTDAATLAGTIFALRASKLGCWAVDFDELGVIYVDSEGTQDAAEISPVAVSSAS